MHSFTVDLNHLPGSVLWPVLQLSAFEDSIGLFCTCTDHGRGDDFLSVVFIKTINTLVCFQLLL